MLMKVSKLTVDFYGQFKAALSGLRRTEPSGQGIGRGQGRPRARGTFD